MRPIEEPPSWRADVMVDRRHWLEAEREVTEGAENAAAEAAPGQGTDVEKRTDAAKTVEMA